MGADAETMSTFLAAASFFLRSWGLTTPAAEWLELAQGVPGLWLPMNGNAGVDIPNEEADEDNDPQTPPNDD